MEYNSKTERVNKLMHKLGMNEAMDQCFLENSEQCYALRMGLMSRD